ncbi:MAG: glycosyltransferase family 4 protein [Lysobacterales bacterium]
MRNGDTDGGKPVRVAVVNTHPIQYFAPLYAYITKHESAIDLTALYCSDYSLRGAVDAGFSQTVRWDIDLLSGYRHVFLGKAARTRKPAGFFSLIVPQLWREIRSGKYDVLWLHGYGYFACVLAFLAAKSMGMPVLLRGETHLQLHRTEWRRRTRDRVLRWCFRYIDGFLAIGSRNRDYYRAMGVPDERIHIVPYTVDNERFIDASTLSADERTQVRKKLGFPTDVPVVLYASKLVERKHPHTLLRAIGQLQRSGVAVSLCLIGSGPMEAELQELAKTLRLKNTVFLGFLNQSELPRAYAASDVFVLAAESEPWGLIVNEVMCAGLPVVISEELGCAVDLLRPGENGLQVVAGDIGGLAEALRLVLSDTPAREQMGTNSRRRMHDWSYAECAAGLRDALSAPEKSISIPPGRD